jgi:hypothetical protein
LGESVEFEFEEVKFGGVVDYVFLTFDESVVEFGDVAFKLAGEVS